MGEVYLARDLELERKVAVRVLPKDLTSDPSRVSRLRDEARATSTLVHPNVCTIYAFGETADGQHFFAMEYVEGETLRQRITQRKLTILENAIGAAAQRCRRSD